MLKYICCVSLLSLMSCSLSCAEQPFVARGFNLLHVCAYKNLYDWISRLDVKVWKDKPMFLAATSPGARGGKSVLELAVNDFGRRGSNVAASFSLPSFHENFSEERGVLNNQLLKELNDKLALFNNSLKS